MAKQIINTKAPNDLIGVGTTANDKKGDSLRAAFTKVNDAFDKIDTNFTELYTALGINADVDLNIGAFEFTGSVISTTDSTPIVIDQSVTVSSDLSVGGDLLPQTANGGDLGSSTLPWRSLHVSNNTVFFGGVPLSLEAESNTLKINNVPISQTIDISDLTDTEGLLGGGGGSTLVNGAYTVSLDANGNLTFPQGTLLGYSDPGGFIINGAVDKDIAIYTYNGADAHGWTFGTDGSLTLPGDIRSEGNINIDINLTDSTLRRWRFGEDGDTVFPNNVSINYSGNNVQFPRIIADSGKAFSIQGQGNSGSAALAWTVNPDAASQYAAVSVSRAGGDNLAKVVLQAQSDSGDAGTAKTWKFDENGALTLPGGGTIAEVGPFGVLQITPTGGANAYQALWIYPKGDDDGDHIHLTAGGGSTELYLGNDLQYVKLVNGGNIEVRANNGVNSAAWQFGTDGGLTFPDATVQSTAAQAFSFSVAADDSTQRAISNNELIKFIGAGGITTSSDAEGYITITGSGGSVSSLVNGAYTVSLGSTGTLTVPANGIITAPINQEFQLQAKDANSVLRNEINLDPNNGTYMSVWSDETTSFSSADWSSGSWNNEGGLGAARFTNAQAFQNFWTTGIGSTVSGIEVSINGGARSPVLEYIGDNGEQYGVELSLDAVPPGGQGTTVPITSLVFYYRLQSKINMDVTGNEILVDAQAMDLDLRTTLNLDLRANQNLNLRGLGAYPVRIYTNGTTHMWEFGNTGTLTFPDATVQSTAWTGTVSQLRNEGNINIDINLSDSTLRRWQFGEDGALTLPSVGKINNGEYDWTFGTSGDLTIPGDIKGTANTSIIVDNVVLFANVTVAQAQPYGPSGSRVFISVSAYPTLGSLVQVGDTVTIGWGAPITVTISNILGGGDFWELRFNQIITAELIQNPGTITITSAQVNTWTFDNDGGLTFPDGTVQTTAWTGTFSTLSVTGAVTAERFNTDQITVVGNRISTTVTNANLELECNGSGGVVINAVADATTASTVKSVGYLGIPQSATTTSSSLAMSDAGKHIYVTTNGQAITIPDNSSVAYPIGTTLTFIAGPSATTVLIVTFSDTVRLAGSSSTGTRTLAANGMATAVKVASTLWYINGIGLT